MSNINVHLTSLGCPKNRVDSEVMAGLLERAGARLCQDPARADVIIVNTCSFLAEACEESIDTILSLAQYKETGVCRRLVVTGCLPQRYGDELVESLPEVDAFLGTNEFTRIVDAVRGALLEHSYVTPGSYLYDDTTPRGQHHLAATSYVKIGEGCSRKCSFCTIPSIRGPQRSRPLDSIVAEVRQLAREGTREVVLIAQDLTRYGRDLGARDALPGLLDELTSIAELDWIRLMYAYPQNFTDELVDRMAAENKVVPYLDIPLQHCCDRILARMGRGIRQSQQQRLIDSLRQRVEGLVLRSTFIVGFPGETEQEFERLCEWVEETRFNHLGVFPFSPEPGTSAAHLDGQLPSRIREERRDILMRTQQPISLELNETLLGQEIDVLVDGPSLEHEWVLTGRTAGQAPEIDGCVFLSFDEDSPNVEPGDMVRTLITSTTEYDCTGRVLSTRNENTLWTSDIE